MINNVIKENTLPAGKFSGLAGLEFLEYLGEGVIVVDNERKILMVNSALENLLGWKASELVGQHCLDYLCCQHPDTATFLCQNLCPLLFMQMTGFQQRPSVHYQEIYMMSKSGQRVEVSASFAPLALSWLVQQYNPFSNLAVADSMRKVSDQSIPPYSILLLRDITEIKRQERIKV